MSKYTFDEKQIVHKIKDINTRQCYHRKMWLDLDVKKLALIHSLKGKYEYEGYKKKRKTRG